MLVVFVFQEDTVRQEFPVKVKLLTKGIVLRYSLVGLTEPFEEPSSKLVFISGLHSRSRHSCVSSSTEAHHGNGSHKMLHSA